jgi:hypothetical protein
MRELWSFLTKGPDPLPIEQEHPAQEQAQQPKKENMSTDPVPQTAFRKTLQEIEQQAEERLYRLRADIETDYALLDEVAQQELEWLPKFIEKLQELERVYLSSVDKLATEKAREVLDAQYLKILNRLENTGPSTPLVVRITTEGRITRNDGGANEDSILGRNRALPPR